MRLVILDRKSFDCDDLDFSGLDSLNLEIDIYDNTAALELTERIKDADIVVTNKIVIDSQHLDKAKHLKLICVAATGTNNIDLQAAKDKAIKVCNVTAYATSSVVQHVFMLITTLSRQFNLYRQTSKNNNWSKSDYFCLLDYPITDLSGLTLGIIGYGELGKAVASVATVLGMRVVIAESFIAEHNKTSQRIPLEKLLSESDIVSLHCPFTRQTQNLISEAEFRLMKPSTILINTARGGIINEQDLLTALNKKQIAAAGLDVLEQEPPASDNPLINSNLSNLIITPHIAWASKQSRQRLLNGVIENIQAYLNGIPKNSVNF